MADKNRILIADDNQPNRELLEAYLADIDCEIDHAADGQETLAKVKSFHPDLILLDVMMPKLSGFEVCQKLKADTAARKVMILMVTALNEAGDIERAVHAGTDDFLSKPVNKTELLKRVENMLKLKDVTDELERLRQYIDEMENRGTEIHSAEKQAEPRRGRASRGQSMVKLLENAVESVVFASRWLQTPLYLGLIVGSVLYCYKFLIKLAAMCRDVHNLSEEQLMLAVLGLVDMTMVANLVYMVVVGGYTLFVSKIDMGGHPDRPEWLEQTNANTLKIKLAASLVGVSGIHLLKSFIEIGEAAHESHNQQVPAFVMWQVIIHLTFLGTSIVLAGTERLLHPPHHSHHDHESSDTAHVAE